MKLELQNPLGAVAQPVSDEGGTASALLISTTQVGVGEIDAAAQLSTGSQGDGPAPALVMHRSQKVGSPGNLPSTQIVQLILDAASRVFTIDVGGEHNSEARIHLGDAAPGPGNNVTTYGRIGIGTLTPRDALDVHGNVFVTGDVRFTSEDVAEDFDLAGCRDMVPPGTVMVINPDGRLAVSRRSYDRAVAGVVVGAGGFRPALVLGRKSDEQDRVTVTLSGKTACLVDATCSPVRPGDLLTTSDTLGHAMKADRRKLRPGAVIGKALGSLFNGQGLVPMLMSLQ